MRFIHCGHVLTKYFFSPARSSCISVCFRNFMCRLTHRYLSNKGKKGWKLFLAISISYQTFVIAIGGKINMWSAVNICLIRSNLSNCQNCQIRFVECCLHWISNWWSVALVKNKCYVCHSLSSHLCLLCFLLLKKTLQARDSNFDSIILSRKM